MSGTIVLDTPEQINGWRYMSAISQLQLEISTGMNYYGKKSVYAGIRGNIIPVTMLPQRATLQNKCLALAMLLHEQESGPVVDRARKVLAAKLDELGLEITLAS